MEDAVNALTNHFDTIALLAFISAAIGIAVYLFLKELEHSRKKARTISSIVFVSCLALTFIGYMSLLR